MYQKPTVFFYFHSFQYQSNIDIVIPGIYSLRFLNDVVPTKVCRCFLVLSCDLKRQGFQNGVVLASALST
jgi:hypothetical protein